MNFERGCRQTDGWAIVGTGPQAFSWSLCTTKREADELLRRKRHHCRNVFADCRVVRVRMTLTPLPEPPR